jgi:hypothetical protein
MTREETIMMLKILRASYPNFYSKFGKDELNEIANLWTEMFSADDFNIVKYALKDLIATHSGFPPDIAAIKNKIKEICSAATGEATNEDLWLMLKKAVSNGIYGSRQEFEKLPPVLQRYLGSPSTLFELAQIDSDTFNTVNHGQFLKQINAIKEREAYSQALPETVRNLIASTYTPVARIGVQTPDEVNSRRNYLLDRLGE